MGMYTKLHLEAELNERGVQEALPVLKELLDRDGKVTSPPGHPFFKLPRQWMLRSASFYHFPISTSFVKRASADELEKYLFINCDLKNYEGQIGAFLDWLTPYIEEARGFTRYEESEHLTEIVIQDGELLLFDYQREAAK